MQTMQLAGVFDEESSRQHSVQANLTQAQRFSGRSGPAGYAWKRLAEGSAFDGHGRHMGVATWACNPCRGNHVEHKAHLEMPANEKLTVSDGMGTICGSVLHLNRMQRARHPGRRTA
jgi:hypothetical protein